MQLQDLPLELLTSPTGLSPSLAAHGPWPGMSIAAAGA